MEACELLDLGHKFDAVIVDEGQDFHELWWLSIDGLFRDLTEKRCFYVFYDPRQNLYVNRQHGAHCGPLRGAGRARAQGARGRAAGR